MNVVTTTHSDRYHASEDCDWYKNGREGSKAQGYTLHEPVWMTVVQAEAARKTACGNCISAGQEEA